MNDPNCFRAYLVVGAGILASAGCGEHPITTWQGEMATGMERLAASLDNITDAQTADASLEEVRAGFQELTLLRRKAPALFRKHGEDKIAKSTMEASQTRVNKGDKALSEAMLKVNSMVGLSEPFCSMLRVESLKQLLSAAEAIEKLRGAPGIPHIPSVGDPKTLRNILDLYETHGPPNVVQVDLRDPGPTTTQDVMDLGDEGATGYELGDPGEEAVLLGPVTDFDAYCSALESIGEVSERDPGRRCLVFKPTPTARPSDIASSSPTAVGSHSSAMPTHVRKRLNSRRFGFDEKKDLPFHLLESPTEKTSLSQSELASLAQDLTTGDFFDKKEAAQKLAEVNPSDIQNRDVRTKVARGFRSLLSDSHYMAFKSETAVRGLVNYAGKHSVPILTSYLQANRLGTPDVVFAAIAKHPSPDGIEALAVELNEMRNSAEAAAAFRHIGSDAEDVVIQVAAKSHPFDQERIFELLGDIGTSKCCDVLEEALNSSRSGIRETASEALRRVRLRMNESP